MKTNLWANRLLALGALIVTLMLSAPAVRAELTLDRTVKNFDASAVFVNPSTWDPQGLFFKSAASTGEIKFVNRQSAQTAWFYWYDPRTTTDNAFGKNQGTAQTPGTKGFITNTNTSNYGHVLTFTTSTPTNPFGLYANAGSDTSPSNRFFTETALNSDANGTGTLNISTTTNQSAYPTVAQGTHYLLYKASNTYKQAQGVTVGDIFFVGYNDNYYGTGDRDFQDAVFEIRGVTISNTSAIPEQSAYLQFALLLGGSMTLLRVRRTRMKA